MDYFGDMVFQLGFSLSRGSHIDSISKDPKVREFLSLVYSFINQRSNCIRFWKGIGKLDSMLQGIWQKIDIRAGSS